MLLTDNEKNSLVTAIFEYLSNTREMSERKDDISSMATAFRLIACEELLSIGKKLNIKSFIEYKPFWKTKK